MFTVSPQQICATLRTPGGDDFTAFCDAIILAHCSSHGVPDEAFRGTLRTNVGDKGVDSEVTRTVPNDTSGYMTVPTLWQYKASDKASVFPKMEEEVNKSEAKKRIENGYGYRLCIADEITPAEKSSREAELTGYVRAINPAAPEAKILSAYDLAQWVGRYLSLMMRYFRKEVDVLGQHILSWGTSIREVTPKYQPVPEWKPTQTRIEQHIDFTKTPPDVVLSLQGESGVGKTRLTFETLVATPGARNLVIYTDNENAALELARIIANDDDVRAILVADECSVIGRANIKRVLQGHRKRVRIIAIDNTGDRMPSASPEMWLARMPNKILDELLHANYPDVPEERRRAYVELSGGFAGLAADMCGNWDPQIAVAGSVQPALGSIRDYMRSRLARPEDYVALMALSLVSRIGHAGELEGELDALCEWIGPEIDKDLVKRAAHRLHDNPGYVARGTAFFYVRPEVIAHTAFADAWQRWAKHDHESFLHRIPPALVESFGKRVARSAPREVREHVAKFFRGFVASLRPADLGDFDTMDRLARLIDTDPEQYVPVLRRLVTEATDAELLSISGASVNGRWGSRRELVWLLERLAALPEFFGAAEDILLRLALCENEPSIMNNATGIWSRFYQIALSGTAIPFPNRLALLERRLADENEGIIELAAKGLEAALRDHVTGSVGPSVVAGRIPPAEWLPGTMHEVAQHFDTAVDCLARSCGSYHDPLRERAFALLMDKITTLLQRRDLDKIRTMVSAYKGAGSDFSDTKRVALCEKVRSFLQWETREVERQKRPKPGDEQADAYTEYIERVRQWLTELTPSNFPGRLVAATSISPWERFEEDEKREWHQELRSLAEEIVEDPALLEKQSDWLFSPDAQSAFTLGEAIGQLDSDKLTLLGGVVERTVRNRIAGFARGYIAGAVKENSAGLDTINKAIDTVESQFPEIAFELFTAGGRKTNALERTLRLVDSGVLAPQYLRGFSWLRDTEALTDPEFLEALGHLVPAAENGDARAGDAALEFLWVRLEDANLGNATPHAPDKVTDAIPPGAMELTWRTLEGLPNQMNGMTDYKWGRVVRHMALDNPIRAIRAAALALAKDRRSNEAQEILTEFAEQYADVVIDELGSLFLRDGEVGLMLHLGNYKALFQAIPDDVLIGWIDKHGIPAAQRIARQLPPPYLGPNNEPLVPRVTEHVLSNYGDDKRVFDNFYMGVHSLQVYMGNIADKLEEEAEAAKPFLDHPLPQIRKWAEREMTTQRQHAMWQRREDEDDEEDDRP